MKFLYNNIYYDVIIEKKNNKNIYIRVKEDLKIYITCNYLVSKSALEKLIEDNKTSIINMIEKQQSKNNHKKEEQNSLLGNKIDIVYCNLFKKPVFEENKLYVTDIKMKDKWFIQKAKTIFKERIDYYYNLFEEEIPYPKLKIRVMKTRWGVCNRRDNSITLNLELIKKDIKYLDYVVVHELSHFVHFDHSKLFWKEVSKYCKDYKIIRTELKE